MELQYKYAESTVKPETVHIDGDTVYLRTDIAEVIRNDEQGNNTSYWTYQEANLNKQEFSVYANLVMSKNAIKGAYDSEKIAALMSSQEGGQELLLILLTAVVDLYSAMAGLM